MTVIVTDSSVYLPRKKAEALHLRVVPMGYTVNGRVCSAGYPEHLEPFFQEYGADVLYVVRDFQGGAAEPGRPGRGGPAGRG